MNRLMTHKGRTSCKYFRTHFTCVWLFTCTIMLMCLKVRSLCKPFRAHLTCVQDFTSTCIYNLMSLKTDMFYKLLGMHCTCVRLFICLKKMVIGGLCISFRTHCEHIVNGFEDQYVV